MSEEKFQRLEEFIALNEVLNPRYPLPALTKSTVTPALANIISRTIATQKPKVILECGSGVSTLIVCYCLSRNGSGHVYSLDHMDEYAQITRDTLHLHHLSEYGTVYVADLVDVHIDDREMTWYNPEVLGSISDIDLLIVDGPPGHLSKMARYPAIPILLNKLKEGAIILVDDYDRPDEKSMVKEWCDKYGFTILHEYDVEKGACALRRIST
jgi:predicted O-methyltransferase YrrM